jgi:hypothetical protein
MLSNNHSITIFKPRQFRPPSSGKEKQMNIESKARAGFTSIMLRGGRMTKWKGQVASYAPHVGHLQNVSVAAMAAALAFGGSVALPSEALAQDVTVTVTDPQVPVDETNNGNGSLIINAPNGVTGKTTAPGIKATNGPNAEDIVIDVLTGLTDRRLMASM